MGSISRRLALAALALLALAGCGAAEQAQQIGSGVDKAADCATLIRQLGNVNVDPRAAAADAEQRARRLDDAVRNVDAQDVRRAAEDLRARLQRLRDAARDADPERQRQAVQEVRQAVERLAQTCNVPVGQLTGNG